MEEESNSTAYIVVDIRDNSIEGVFVDIDRAHACLNEKQEEYEQTYRIVGVNAYKVFKVVNAIGTADIVLLLATYHLAK